MLKVLPGSKLLRGRVISFLHRLVECLGDRLLPFLPSALSALLPVTADAADVSDVSALLSQLAIRYKAALGPLLAKVTCPFATLGGALGPFCRSGRMSCVGCVEGTQLQLHREVYAQGMRNSGVGELCRWCQRWLPECMPCCRHHGIGAARTANLGPARRPGKEQTCSVLTMLSSTRLPRTSCYKHCRSWPSPFARPLLWREVAFHQLPCHIPRTCSLLLLCHAGCWRHAGHSPGGLTSWSGKPHRACHAPYMCSGVSFCPWNCHSSVHLVLEPLHALVNEQTWHLH
jgi:hypothetical protein